MPSEDLFWTRLAPKYAQSPVSDIAAYEQSLMRTRSYLHAQDTVLEIGCGTGSTALRLNDAVEKIVATDFAEGMIRIAQDKARAANVENVDFRIADAALEEFSDGSFDAALAFNLLHLLQDLEGTLDRVHSVLKPGGVLISKTVCLGGSIVLPMAIKAMQLVGKAPYVSIFTPDHLQAALLWAGFEILETGNHNKGTRGHFIAARKI